jgi:hypothetical protein
VKDGVHNGSGGAKNVRVRYEVMRCWRGYRGRPMAEGNKRRGQGMRYNGHIFSGRLTWKGAGHLVGGEWTMRWGEGPHGQEKGRWTVSEDEEGLKGVSLIAWPGGKQMAQKITRQRRGPRWLNIEGKRMSGLPVHC